MKRSIAVPRKVSIESAPKATWLDGLVPWLRKRSAALPPTPHTEFPPNANRQALIEAIKRDPPSASELAALRAHLTPSAQRPSTPGSFLTPHATPRLTPRRHIQNPALALGGYPDQASVSALALAYRASGGLCRADDWIDQMAPSSEAERNQLANAITTGQILSFKWCQSDWLPLFQFKGGGTSQHSGAQQVIHELSSAFDDWEKVVWFVQPNAWLDGAAPIEWLTFRLPEVLDAARADRFVAAG